MTDDLRARARALPRPATPGPWSYRPSGNAPAPVFTVSVQFTDRGAMAEKDAEAIAALPDALALIDELIAEVERLRAMSARQDATTHHLASEVERLRPLAELWDALSHELRVRGILSVDHNLGPKPFEVYSAALNEAVRGRTLPEAVRALLEEVERGE